MSVGQFDLEEVVTRSISADRHLDELLIVGFHNLDKFAQSIVDIHRAHILALDVDHCGGGVRVDSELALLGHMLLDAVVVSHVQGQVDDAVATVDGGVLNIVSEGAGVGGCDVETVARVEMFSQRGILDEDLVCRRDGEIQHIDAVAARGGDEVVVVGASRRVVLAAPLVRLVVARGGVGDELVGAVHGQHEVDHAVATCLGGEGQLVVECSKLCGQRVEAVGMISVAETDGVIDRRLHDLVDREYQLIHIGTTIAVRDGVGVEAGNGEVVATPLVRQGVAAHHGGFEAVDGRVDGEVEREDAVAAVGGLQRVAVDAADAVVSATPVVRSLALADADGAAHIVGRVDDQREVEGAVAAVGGLQVEVALAGGVHGEALPDVRQLGVADGVALLEVVARVDGDGDSVDVETSVVVGHGVSVESGFGEGHAAPGVRFALTEGDRVVVDHAGLVDVEGEHVETVATGSGLQGVVVGARDVVVVAAPGVGVVAADGGGVTEDVGGVDNKVEHVDAVTARSG